jgi:DNA mismatch repair ATPase MutS
MQKGLFYEIYAMPEDPLFPEVCDLLGILQTRVDKSLPISINNPRFAGFPIDSANRHLKALAENEFTVRIVDETKDGKVITRNVTRTINNTSLIDDLSNDTKWIVYIVIIENEKNSEMAITCMNLQIGEVFIYPDQAFNIDYLQEILAKYNCGEIVIHTNSKKEQIIDKKYTLVNSPSSLKVSYKEEFLQKIYKKTIGISLLESFNLELLQIASDTFVHLLNYALKYDL